MLLERDLSGSGKVYKAVPYIYIYMCVCVCARARMRVRAHACVGLLFKIVRIENLTILDRILLHEILYATPNLQHNNTAKSS